MAITKMRKPFLATDNGTATATTNNFRQKERNRSWASTMVVTTSIKLERMLLHSFATSTVKPGMVRKKPSCDTGTPTTVNRSSAVKADHCWRNVMMRASMNEGIGTIHKRKPSGKRKVRAARVPKHRTKAPAHQLTTAS